MTPNTDPRPAWRAIIAAGGLMPVSDTERARHTRVQATLRAVYGLPETASEEQLIDAREGDQRSITELATQYLRNYSTRLDPDGDLDDVDRAALAWRDMPTPIDVDAVLAALSALGASANKPAAPQPPLFPDAWTEFLASLKRP